MSRTSGARFPDPPEGHEATMKRYRVTLTVVQELVFEVNEFDADDAEESARLAYRHGQEPTESCTPYVDDINVAEIES